MARKLKITENEKYIESPFLNCPTWIRQTAYAARVRTAKRPRGHVYFQQKYAGIFDGCCFSDSAVPDFVLF